MKKILFAALGLLCLVSCAKQPCCQLEHPCYAYDATIYELNTRQLTEEGTFKAAEAVLPALKEIGVDIIWIMPIQKIGVLERKGTLGSYYAITDYCQFNPEFGTRADFEHFLAEAHNLGLKVILDWVANHTAPDSEWTKNDGWHYRDSLGNLMVQYDWTDISKLNYDNQDMRAAMKQAMHWWMDTIGIDGFRCDVAHRIPISFWEEARVEAEAIKPDVVIVAESSRPYDMRYAFDAEYNWSIARYAMRPILDKDPKFADKGGMAYVRAQHIKNASVRPKGALHWNMTDNHDFATDAFDNRMEKRLGNACCELQLAFSFAIDGVPFLFNGQEIAHDKRVSLFGHKDCWIDWKTDGATAVAKDRTEKIKAWAKMRKEHKALSYGSTEWIDNDCPAEVLSFKRVYEGANDVLFVGNFSDKEIKVKLANGSKYTLAPWGYIFAPQSKR